MDDYAAAAPRWLKDANHLHAAQRYPGASHAYGLAAECAIKNAMDRLPGADRQLPHKHIPDLIDDAMRWLQGRRHRGLNQLLQMHDYMRDWVIDNRYWPDHHISEEDCERYKDHARRTLAAAGLGV